MNRAHALPACPALVGLALAALAAATPVGVHAASLAIVVHGADGQPAPDVVVEVTAAAGARPAAAPPAAPSASAPPVVIEQKDMRFVPLVTAVPVGTTVRFTNDDTFDHHLRSMPGGPLGTVPPAQQFEFRIAGMAAGRPASVDVAMTHPGTVLLGCNLHTSMRGHLYVSRSPYVAVTDARGQVRLDGLPDGAATVSAWHPEQLLPQAPLAVTLGPASAAAPVAMTLNFSPRPPRTRHHAHSLF